MALSKHIAATASSWPAATRAAHPGRDGRPTPAAPTPLNKRSANHSRSFQQNYVPLYERRRPVGAKGWPPESVGLPSQRRGSEHQRAGRKREHDREVAPREAADRGQRWARRATAAEARQPARQPTTHGHAARRTGRARVGGPRAGGRLLGVSPRRLELVAGEVEAPAVRRCDARLCRSRCSPRVGANHVHDELVDADHLAAPRASRWRATRLFLLRRLHSGSIRPDALPDIVGRPQTGVANY